MIDYTHWNSNEKVVEMGCLGWDFKSEGRSQSYKAPQT